jgi:hypothetical protein
MTSIINTVDTSHEDLIVSYFELKYYLNLNLNLNFYLNLKKSMTQL